MASNPEKRQTPAPTRLSTLSLKLGIAGLVFFAGLFIAVAIFAGGGNNPGTRAAADSLGTVLGVSTEPAVEPTRTRGGTPTPITSRVSTTPAIVSVPGDPRFPTTGSTQPPTPTALSTSTNPPVITDAPTTGTTTAPPAPATTAPLSAAAVARQIGNDFGVVVITDGQDWGSDEQSQHRNLGALRTALIAMPDSLVAQIAAGPGGPLTFLSNNNGRTVDGWQPYGDRAANFYTNEDRGANGSRQSHQIVLQTGSGAQTIAHEMAHAYQMIGVGTGEYVDSLLTDDMKSFMAATGWVQLVSDDELRANADQSWATINGMFRYEGRNLTYINEFGTSVSLYTPNPIEGYAEAAGLYYAHGAGSLPDWSEYWSWFDANLG